jgi:lipopolysaccharide export system protein LptA
MNYRLLLATVTAASAAASISNAQSAQPAAATEQTAPATTPEALPARPVEPGAPRPLGEKRAKGPTEITAREASFDNRTHEAGFSGSVLVKDPEFSLSCERLSVYLKKPEEKNAGPLGPKENSGGGSIEKAIAEIDVVITQEKQDANGKKQRYIGRAKKAVFDNVTGDVTLSGWPTIAHNEGGTLSKQIVSREESCVIVINRAGRIDVRGYHTTTLQDTGAIDPGAR